MASSLLEKPMKIIGALTILTLTLLPLSAHAGDRGTDASLGAVSGAVVFGPVGAVAGALVGFTAGPAIGHSWGLNGSPRRHARYHQRAYSRAAGDPRASYHAPAPNESAAGGTQAAPVGAPAVAAPARVAKNKAPPVQALE
jgi:hypothetical protein